MAVQLARRFDGEIVSVDSRQIYRGLDLGSGKDLAEYETVPYHLIDIADPHETFHLAAFLAAAREAIARIGERGKLPILAGGTALYLDALLNGYRLEEAETDWEKRAELDALSLEQLTAELRRYPEAAAAFSGWENKSRVRRALELAQAGKSKSVRAEAPAYQTLILGVYFPRQEVHARIAGRLEARFDAGMIEEVRRLHDEAGVPWAQLESFGLEYREIALYCQGKSTLAEMKQTLLFRIRQFAKRQDIWFRKMEREGRPIHWLRQDRFREAAELVETFLAGRELPVPDFRMMDTFYGRRS